MMMRGTIMGAISSTSTGTRLRVACLTNQTAAG